MKRIISVLITVVILASSLTLVGSAIQGFSGVVFTEEGGMEFNEISGAVSYTIVIEKDDVFEKMEIPVSEGTDLTVKDGKVSVNSEVFKTLVGKYVKTYNIGKTTENAFKEFGIVSFEINLFAYGESKNMLAATTEKTYFFCYDFSYKMVIAKKPIDVVKIKFNNAIEDRGEDEYEKIYSVNSQNAGYLTKDPLNIYSEDGVTEVDFVSLGNSYWFEFNVLADAGYTFSGDTRIFVNDTDVTNTSSTISYDVDTGNTYITAKWHSQIARSKFNLSFSANGGYFPPDKVLSDKEGIVTVPDTIPTKRQSEFLGWASKSNAVVPEYKQGDSFKITEDKSLYAVWNLIEVSMKESKASINYGQILKVNAVVDEGYTICWFIDDNDTGKTGKTFEYDYSNGNHTIVAKVKDSAGKEVEGATSEMKVTVNGGFFQKLVAFFKYTLFKNSRYVEI